jgi:hypothetical protein
MPTPLIWTIILGFALTLTSSGLARPTPEVDAGTALEVSWKTTAIATASRISSKYNCNAPHSTRVHCDDPRAPAAVLLNVPCK